MKKIKVLFVVIFVLLFASCGKPREVNYDDTEERDGITYVKGESKSFTGVVKDYYDNENLKIEATFKNGKEDGSLKGYYPNGNLLIEDTYKDGKKNGIYKSYRENGNLLSEMTYKDNKLNGSCKFYDSDGNLIAKCTYKDDKIVY